MKKSIELKNKRANVEITQKADGLIYISIQEDDRSTDIMIHNDENHRSSLNVHLRKSPPNNIKKSTRHHIPPKGNKSGPFTVVELNAKDKWENGRRISNYNSGIINVFYNDNKEVA